MCRKFRPPPLTPSHKDQHEKGARGQENTYIIPANLSGRNQKQINFWKNALTDGIEIGEEKIEKTHIIEREQPPSPPPLISPLVTPIVSVNEKGTIRDRLRPRQMKAVAAAARTAQPTQAGGVSCSRQRGEAQRPTQRLAPKYKPRKPWLRPGCVCIGKGLRKR